MVFLLIKKLAGEPVQKTLLNSTKNYNLDASILAEMDSTVRKDSIHGEVSAYIPTLTFLSGPSIGKEIPLLHREITLGRGNDCDIVIADPAVSRKHLQISCRKFVKKSVPSKLKVVLKDLDSKNGTLVNYSSIKKTVLKPGDKIILGRVILKYEQRDLAEQQFFDEIYRLATLDNLTSLNNKATITRILKEEIAGSVRDQRWVSVVLVDIDKFKSLNDIHGHLKGDRVLQTVAEVILSTVRRRDKVGRFGGDEFLIVLPETEDNGAVKIAERIRHRLESSVNQVLELTEKVTASLGVASKRATVADPEQLLEQADVALYRSKSLGRNRVELWKNSSTEKS
ncbi:MAG: diguanylate cyclase [Acidobacteria bacterium]|nr:diguanylate cyclase [Acidobacteriota bacterium]